MQDTKQQDLESRRGPWMILAAAILFGTSGTAQALAPEGAQPAVVGALRLAIGGVFLLTLSTAKGNGRKKWPLLATLGAAGCMAMMQLCFFAAIARTGVALGTTIFIGSYPVFAGLLGLMVSKERPSRRWVIATSMAIAGCILLANSGNETAGVDFTGIVLALSTGVAYAIYSVVVKGLLGTQSALSVIAIVSFLGAVMLSPILLTSDLGWLMQPSGIVTALYLGLLATAAPYMLFARGLRSVSVSLAATLNLAEPFTATLLGVLLLNEHLSPRSMTGMGLLLCGLCFITFNPRIFRKAIH